MVSEPAGAPRTDERVVCVLRSIQDGGQARKLVAFAGALADGLGARLALVTVAEAVPPLAVAPMMGVPIALAPELPGLHEPPADLAAIAEAAGVHPVHCQTATGTVAAVLDELSGQPSTALLVVGDEGDGAAWSAVTGAPARRALGDLPVPLVLVPGETEKPSGPAWRVAAGVLEVAQSRSVLAIAGALVQRLGGDLLLLVDERSMDATAALAELVLPEHADLRVEPLAHDPSGRLDAVLAHGEADLLVLAPPERGLVASALLGSVFHAVAAGGHGAILVAPESARG